MTFEQEINMFENMCFDEEFIIKEGRVPILFSAPHTVTQVLPNNVVKLSESYTKAISLYLHEKYNTYSIVKVKDNGTDSNKNNNDQYNNELNKLIKEKGIKLVIDLHGAAINRDFDVEFGTLNNLSADFSTIKELEEAFIENGITGIIHNEPFKGGAIIQKVYGINDIDVIQLEINRRYRDINNISLLEKVVNSLGKFIEQYNSYINK